MKKTAVTAFAVVFAISTAYIIQNGWDNTKLELFRFLSYFTITNNPLLTSFDKDLADIKGADGRRVDLDQLISGGLSKGGVKSIDMPIMIRPDETDFPDEAVVTGVYHENEARAYPHGILNWHEIVNDWIGNTPVSVTLCPLCDTNPVFVRQVEGKVLKFGVSGKLFQSCLVMYDKATNSLWAQPWGLSIAGKLVNKNLQRIPAVKTTWGKWKRQHPKSLILSKRTGEFGNYNKYPYGDYNTNDSIVFPVRNKDLMKRHPKTPIVILWDKEDRQIRNGFGGNSRFLFVDEISQKKERQIDFFGKPLTVKWDSSMNYPRAYSDNKEIPISSSFLFVYTAMFVN